MKKSLGTRISSRPTIATFMPSTMAARARLIVRAVTPRISSAMSESVNTDALCAVWVEKPPLKADYVLTPIWAVRTSQAGTAKRS